MGTECVKAVKIEPCSMSPPFKKIHIEQHLQHNIDSYVCLCPKLYLLHSPNKKYPVKVGEKVERQEDVGERYR